MLRRKLKMNSKRSVVNIQKNICYLVLSFSVKCSVTNVPALWKVVSNEAMKPSQLLDHLEKKYADKKDKPVAFF